MDNVKKAAVTKLTAFYASSKKTDKTQVDKRDFYSLSYRYNGKISVEARGQRMLSEGGSVTFIPKGLPYTTEIIDEMRMAVVHFKLDKDIDFRNAAVIKTDDAGVRLLFEKLIRSFHIDAPLDFYCMSVFYELLARLENISKKENAKEVPDKIRLIKECMEQRFSDSSVSIASLADDFGISTSYLRREFLRAYGMTPIAFLRAVRIGNSKNILESGYLSVAEIAEQCGFSSASYFIQVFCKVIGESPERYRRKIFKNKKTEKEQ